MVRRPVDAKPDAQALPEGRGELRAAVRDNGVQEVIEAEDMTDEEVGQVRCISVGPAGGEVTHLGQATDHDPYCVEPR